MNSSSQSEGGSSSASASTTSGWKTLDTQVGGHTFSHGEYDHQKLGIVDLENGFILKSLQKPPRGLRELNFYERVFDPKCTDEDLLAAREFLSPYGGTVEKNGAKFIKLKNLTAGFIQPCVADLKMGRVTYDQEATPEKIKHEISKFPPLQNLGFQFTGMTMYNPVTESRKKFEKSFCRSMTEKTIVTEGLATFFGHPNLRRDVIQVLLDKLRKMELWFLKQKKFSFIASSLLIVYEGMLMRNLQGSDSKSIQTQNGQMLISDEIPGPKMNKHSPPKRPSEDKEDQSTDCLAEVKKAKKDDCTERIEEEKASSLSLNTSDGVKPSNEQNSILIPNDSCSGPEQTAAQTNVSGLPDVHLIDFAHAFPAQDIDHNFLFGLQKLISCLNELLHSK